MSALTDFFDNLKERLKNALQEQQESELFISIKERYESLSPNMQALAKWGSIALVGFFILWLPLSSFLDSATLNSEFEARRQALKELLKIERDYANISASNAQHPFTLKAQFDQKLLAFGVKIEQIKNTQEVSEPVIGSRNVEQKGISYEITHVTIRQAIDIAYELEQTNKHLKLSEFEVAAEAADPHFYNMKLKLISFMPKIAAATTPEPGGRSNAQ